MAFFQPTTITWGQGKNRVASVAGSAGDSDQLALAGYFLTEALQNWEAAKNWKYLITSTSISITSGTSTYDLPADFKKPYSLRTTTTSPRVLEYIDKRFYDQLRPNQSGSTIPTGYMLIDKDGLGKFELVPANNLTDTLLMYYYRRHTIPSGIIAGTTASDATVMDFPAAYTNYLFAWARALYLANKGGEDQRMDFWMRLAVDGLAKARGEDEFLPDDVPGFYVAPNLTTPAYNPNNIMPYVGDY